MRVREPPSENIPWRLDRGSPLSSKKARPVLLFTPRPGSGQPLRGERGVGS
jgi:hypothetical protein